MRTGIRAIAVALLALGGDPAPASDLAGHARLVDGDTIEIAGQSVRLHGIDAPESGQHCLNADGNLFPCGALAADMLGQMIAGHRVVCSGHEHDRYGRLVAICRVGGRDLNARMVRLGLALAYVKYSDDYLPQQREATRAGRGLWAGTFQPPAQYRAERRQGRVAAAPVDAAAGCRIKGNISANGRIYHMPGSRWYARTRISPARGEQWFCSEAAARRAGWRPPRG